MEPGNPHRKRKAVAEFFRMGKRARAVTPQSSTSSATPDDQPPDGRSAASALQDESSILLARTFAAELAPPTLSNNLLNLETENLTPAEKAWNGLKTILPVVEKVSVVFPPLQSAVGGLIAVITKFEVRIKEYIYESSPKVLRFHRLARPMWRR